MATENMIKFYKGALANLPSAGTNGAIYITTDEGAIYLGTGVGMKRLGDFVQVDAVASLPASANTSALYYCVAENVLAKWTGTEWKQVNKQPTKDELKVLLGLDAEGDVTKAIAAAKKAGDDAQADVDTLTEYVGTFTHDTAKTVVEYINAKTDGIATSGNLETLAGRVTAVEGDVATIKGDYLKSTDKTELEGKITAAQTAADNAQVHSNGVASDLADHEKDTVAHITAAEREAWNGKVTMDDVEAMGYLVASDIAGKADATQVALDIAAAVEGEADLRVAGDEAIEAKIGTVADGKTVVQMIEEAQAAATYDDTALDGRVTDVEGKVNAIEADYLKAEDKTALQNNIDAVADDVAEIAGDYLKAADKTELQGKIDAKADQTALDGEVSAREAAISGLQTQINTIMSNPDAEGAINSINEFTQYVADHGTIADGFRADIDQNKTDIAAEVKRAGDAEIALAGRLDVLEAIDHDAYVAADSALKSELESQINAKADTSALESAVETLEAADADQVERIAALEAKFTGDSSVADQIAAAKQEAIDAAAGDATSKANAAETAAKGHADSLNTAMSARVDALEAIDHEHANKAELDLIASGDKAKWDAAEAKAHEHTNAAELDKIVDGDVAKWNAAQANAEATAAAALDTAKTELEGKIAAAEKAAKDHADTEVGKVQTALDNYKTENDTVVAGKADKATTLAGYGITDAMTADDINALLTWGEF